MHRSACALWLGTCCVLILVMVLVGGITRLTNAGLSITEWRPITGIVPPMSMKSWIIEKEKYEKTPEYKYTNFGISMGDFKRIYMTEYFHRLLGRVLGAVFFVPMFHFIAKGKIKGAFAVRIGLVSLLGMLQGIMGWMMVKSGLVDVPYVSHFRLSVHLFLTVLIFSLLWYSLLECIGVSGKYHVSTCKYSFLVLIYVITVVQMLLGAFVAGLDAGLIFNTFPLMDGEIIPKQILKEALVSGTLLRNGPAVQFLHRIFAAVVFLCAATTLALVRTRTSWVLFFSVCVQFLLGVVTLVHGVPVKIAAAHQIWSFVVIALEIYLLKVAKRVVYLR
ncbi:COX15/CtaA family protein [Candidatus Anaplasma sp. TIGMIC]|uniref:COX15/CtaA family protein n=1 Tax=Candidatus Anaplasma sp. TIGMIC TaxID=3020713 RepID=UPI00232AF6A2|nr:COX15/CtaA family protein [Candidatus Anaplasma sp. TIGMIC]MDB1135121.1 COX15/CtaA family protein [Candidatus Anaplasma sp. TIGMIC]